MMLTVQSISKRYSNDVLALDNVNLSVGKGMFGLLGPNGAGKSSLMRTLATIQSPDDGDISFNDLDVLKHPQLLRRVLGYLPQDFGVYPRVSAYRLLDYLAVMKGLQHKQHRRAQVLHLLEQTNLIDHKDKHVATFSGGMLRRFGIAQALISNPQLLIVDEPTAGLDPQERNRFYSLLSEISEHTTLILSTHIIEDIQGLCNEMAIINQGKIITQGPKTTLIETLNGNVWKTEVDESQQAAIDEKYQVLPMKSVGSKRHVRVLSTEWPNEIFTTTEPVLEDVYFASLLTDQSN